MTTAKHRIHTLSRRGLLLGLVAAPSLVLAHEGHGAADVVADATVLSQMGKDLTLKLALANLAAEPITLMSVHASGAASVEAVFLTIAGKDVVELELTLRFDGEIPGIFTAVLDFGEDGQGPVLVMP